MAAPANVSEFLELVRKSGVSEEKRLEAHVGKLRAAGKLPPEPSKLAGILVRDGFLTRFQAEQILQGKWRRFTIGKYKVLEQLGHGGMGSVYLCEHKLMRRRVAVKILPKAKAKEEAALERFKREARVAAALDHPNIVHAYDIDDEDDLHYLVMEYVDGSSLQEIIGKTGPMNAARAACYMRDAAIGLEYAHKAGIVHRDIKPGNILVDRHGVVKILDMGLARFFNDQEDILTRKFDENVLGTADYLAPEQALDSHEVDYRADIYSLGATFYFLLTGKTPLGEGTVGQKLMWLHSRQVKSVASVRPDVPAGLSALIEEMMAKNPAQRQPSHQAVADALAAWVHSPVPPPLDVEMPHLSPAATGVAPAESTVMTSAAPPSPSPRSQQPTPPPGYVPAASRVPGSAASGSAASGSAASGSAASGSAASAPASSKPSLPASPAPFRPRGQKAGAVRPLPYPAPGKTAPAASPADQPEFEEPAPWERLASETEDPSAYLDTASLSSAHKVVQAKQKRARQQERRKLGQIAIVIALAALAGLAFGFWKFFRPADSGPGVRDHLTVGKNAKYRTIELALREAQSGDVIELLDDVHDENLTVDKQRGWATAVTIQPATGKNVVWRPKKDAPLLVLSKARGFTMKGPGLTLDGTLDAKRSLKSLVLITLDCPKLTIEDVRLQGYTQNAVRIVNSGGEDGNPMRLLNLEMTPAAGAKAEAALYFDASPSVTPKKNDYIEIRGPLAAGAIKLKDPSVLGANVQLPK